MNKLIKMLPLLTAGFLTTNALAEQTEQIKNWNVGVGTYGSVINIDNRVGDEDIDFSGVTIIGTYAFNDNVALRTGVFSLENDDNSDLESSGLDINIYYGTGFATDGFKAYIGGGLFKDTWEFDNTEVDYSGIQLSGGIGYNWQYVSLELLLSVRSPDDYADEIEKLGGSGEVSAVSSSLLLSARF